jgi:two-component system nitrate/nitrite response regulator NarL
MLTAMTLLIVDDHEGFRAFARAALSEEGFDVTGDVADGETAIAAAAELHPDVVLLDVQLPGIDGFEVARRLALQERPPRVIMTSTRSASDYGSRLADAPVAGFIPKQELSGAALEALLARP